jgi:hypothetical protein
MNALVTGIAAFCIAALGAICPTAHAYVPALFAVIVAGGYVGGTIFSLQSNGVYDLHIRAARRALKRLGRLPEAIDVLNDGLRSRGARGDSFRRAVALWNVACYRALINVRCMSPETMHSIVAVLDEAIRNVPDFREGLTEHALDRDLVSLVGNPIFDQWRSEVLDTKRLDTKR